MGTERRVFQSSHVLAGIPTFFRAPHVPNDSRELAQKGVTVGVLGVPYEGGNTYRPGASYGPHCLRTATAQVAGYLREYDFDLFDDFSVADCGDVPIHPTNIDLAHRQIADSAFSVLDAGAIPILVGGDHSISTGGVTALCKKSQGKVGLLILDSHIDVNEDVGGADLNSNGSWIAKVLRQENLLPENIAIVGVRGATIPRNCWEYAIRRGITIIPMEEVRSVGVCTAIEKGLGVAQNATESFYVSYDVDSVDPAFAPGTGAPEPGGFTSMEIMKMAYMIGRANPRAFDIVELFMCYDPSGITAVLASYVLLHTLAGCAA